MALSKTVLYYTSNREKPEFEAKVRQTTLENCGGIPIISVSQKPIDFGENICVGDVGCSYVNAFRQILIGAKAAKTDYLYFAESDFLYPPAYFSFNPTGKDLYRYNNICIVFKKIYSRYYRKEFSIGAQVAKREFVVRELEIYLKDQPQWIDGPFRIQHPNGVIIPDWNDAPCEYFSTEVPCVSFKTGDGVAKSARTMPGAENRLWTVPYWGEAQKLGEKYLL